VNTPLRLADLPASLALAVDEVCDDFERFWRRARRRGEALPTPETFVVRVAEAARPALRSALEVLQSELLAEAEFPDIPGYSFQKELARGPMGVVYRVRCRADGRELALKTIDSADIARWSRSLLVEGEVLTDLRHPHIVPVESFGEHDGLHYLVMPLVEGGDLRQRLGEFVLGAGGRERLERIGTLMAKVAGAVAFLHQRGILHRDLKPSNILLTVTGDSAEPLVCDFGLARWISEPHPGSQSPQLVGTLAYMAPEQMEGRQELSEAADVWSLGAILHELLTGSPPFTADRRLDTVRKLAAAEPSPPHEMNPAVAGAALGWICRRCLQRDPAARYLSAAELVEDLTGAQSSVPA
jgi:serine/threonine protein kinase